MNIKRTLEWTIDTDQTLQTYADQFGEQVEEFTARLIQERLLSLLEEEPGLSVTQSITMEELKAISYETLIQHPKNDVAVEVDTSSLGSWHGMACDPWTYQFLPHPSQCPGIDEPRNSAGFAMGSI